MSEGMFSRHAALNAGAIPASAEELSQRYLKLFQQYSRLKAQHAVLKKAVIKEQASTVALQGNVKEKEKELRKLQEQLDLLAFHNERLTKRIQAVQDNEQKGSHFSLLGGSVKKELEKSAQALDEANMDLERKIEENEKLHEELTERQFEFTESINKLLQQIQDLEKKVNDLQDENANLQAESKEHSQIQVNVDSCKETELQSQIDQLKQELKKKTDLLEEKNQQAQQSDARVLSEVQSLRAILLAKVGNMKDDSSLYDTVPEASEALKTLENQAERYFSSIDKKADVGELPFEIAEKLVLSAETYSSELLKLTKQLEDTKAELQSLLVEKDQQVLLQKEKSQEQEKEYSEKAEAQSKKVSELLATIEANERNQVESMSKLEKINKSLEEQNIELQKKLETQKQSLEKTLQELKDTKETNTLKDSADKEIQVDVEPTKELPKDGDKDEEEDVFVYPKESSDKQIEQKSEEEEEEEEEEVFVYTGMDAVPATEATPNTEEVEEPVSESDKEQSNKIYDDSDILEREEKLKAYYEQKLNNLTEKIQITDSKALRFASMYKSLKDKLIKEDKEKQLMVAEIERLNKEVKNVQDLLSTTESGYQKQLDTMTEFISSLQQNAEEQQRHSQPQRRNNNYHNQR